MGLNFWGKTGENEVFLGGGLGRVKFLSGSRSTDSDEMRNDFAFLGTHFKDAA